MNKTLNKKDSWKLLEKGITLLYNPVSSVYGPNAGNAILGGDFPRITHDGVSVAKSLDIEEPGVREAVELFREAAEKLNNEVGDGTTSVTVLTYHLLKEARKAINRGKNPQELRRELEQACSSVITQLSSLSESIEGNKDKIAEVATISAGDPEIGKLIANVFVQVGKDGVVSVEKGAGLETKSEIIEGFTFNSGYMTQHFADRQEVEIEEPAIIITDGRVNSVHDILPILNTLSEAGKESAIIIADEMEAQTLGVLVANKKAGNFNSVVVSAPSFGERMKEELKDIAALTGATVISIENGIQLKEVGLRHLGTAQKVIVGRDKTTIIGGAGDIKQRVKQIEEELKTSQDKLFLEQRLARINGQVAVIRVGGASDNEVNEKKDRIDDAVYATKAALAEGIVAGGGITLLELSNTLEGTTTGHKVLKKALKQPTKVLLRNIGIKYFFKRLKPGFGVNVRTSTPKKIDIVDMKAEGIIDPVKVTRGVIQTSVSIVATIATTSVFIVEKSS